MLKPSFRFFIIPLGAVCTLASTVRPRTPSRAPSAIRLRCWCANRWIDCSDQESHGGLRDLQRQRDHPLNVYFEA